MDKADAVLLAVLFIAAFFLWTLPIQGNPLPFGEGDAAWHFAVGDYIGSTGKTISLLPDYISYWYYNYNPLLGPGALEYPPPNHINYAFAQVFGGERFVPVSIYKAVVSFLGIFTVYFLIRKLYGTLPAFVAGFGMVFSFRDITTYLFGQQPTLISFVFIPLVLYPFYHYLTAYYEGVHRPVYLYLTGLLAASQFLLHIQGVVVTLLILIIFTALMTLKYKKFPLSGKNLMTVAAAIVIFLAISLPFLTIYIGPTTEGGPVQSMPRSGLSRLLSWGIAPETVSGSYPASFITFSGSYSYWLLPFLGLGIISVVLSAALSRKPRELLMLSWLIGVYVVLHLDVFLGTDFGRIARMMLVEGPLFFSIMAIGAFTLPSYLRLARAPEHLMRHLLSGLVVLIILLTAAPNAYSFLNSAYQGVSRLTPAQHDAAEWMRENLPENIFVFDYGTLTYPKTRWLLAVSQRHVLRFEGDLRGSIAKSFELPTYLLIDYSDLVAVNAQGEIQQIKSFESAMPANASLIYDENDIKIYEMGVIKSN